MLTGTKEVTTSIIQISTPSMKTVLLTNETMRAQTRSKSNQLNIIRVIHFLGDKANVYTYTSKFPLFPKTYFMYIVTQETFDSYSLSWVLSHFHYFSVCGGKWHKQISIYLAKVPIDLHTNDNPNFQQVGKTPMHHQGQADAILLTRTPGVLFCWLSTLPYTKSV